MEPRTYKFNQSEVVVSFCDITKTQTDVIVSSDDTELTMGGGVSRAIHEAGGDIVFQDSRKHVPAELGDVVVSSAGRLPHKWLFHCITLRRSIQTPPEMQSFVIRKSIGQCLAKLVSLGATSIAFPAIGAGSAHFSIDNLALLMAEGICEFCCKTNQTLHIEICLQTRSDQTEYDYLGFYESFAACHYHSQAISNEKNDRENIAEEKDEVSLKKISKQQLQENTKPTDIFISYARVDKDSEIAAQIQTQLEKKGFSVWRDVNGLYSGAHFQPIITKVIERTKVVVFISSESSNNRPWVSKEICYAISIDKPIIPVKIDKSPYSENYVMDLHNVQFVDWTENRETAFEMLVNSANLYKFNAEC